ncbi:hypothetical protein CHCC20331_1621 [Bacillus paralicheniformis]|nr:hypothetical protein CHCC20331_1621 [Bacillus paralicheniformis]
MKTLMRWLFDRPLKKGTVLEGRYRINRVLGMGSYVSHILPKNLGDPVSASSSSRERQKHGHQPAGGLSTARLKFCGNWICLPRPVYMRCFKWPASGLS